MDSFCISIGGIDGNTNSCEDEGVMAHCLVGKLISGKPFNKVGVHVVIFQAWHFIKDLEMEEVDGDRFIFSFPSSSCRLRVMEQAS